MLYRPSPSETTVRTFSIRAGLAASTVTPGSTAPVVSFTTPAMPPWANVDAGTSKHRRTPAQKPAAMFLTMVLSSPKSINSVQENGTQAPAPSAGLPKPGFHHIHMNSTDPTAAINEFLKVYPASTRVTGGGFEGLKTANDVYMLFTKVTTPPPAPGPDRVSATAPQTAFWHHVWAVADGRQTLKSLRASDPNFDARRMIAQWIGPEGGRVDFSSDTYSGFLTNSQLAEAKAKGGAPTHRGGYFNWYGPDGVVMETTDGPTERYTIVGMFQEQPYCALFWYKKHLNADDRPASGGRGAAAAGGGGRGPAQAAGPASEAECRVTRSDDV